MWNLSPEEPLAIAATAAIRGGHIGALEHLLRDNPGLANARIGAAAAAGAGCGMSRTLLHAATDWPGHFPNGAATVAALISYGADVNARFAGPHAETPLHWAASSDDVAVLDALLDRGADIEAPGGVIGGGTPLADAVAFGQWQAARHLVERGARINLWQAAALGLMDRVREHFAGGAAPAPAEITNAFWAACHGGQIEAVDYLLGRGADLNWIGYDRLTPMDAASRSGATELVEWLRSKGGRPAKELR